MKKIFLIIFLIPLFNTSLFATSITGTVRDNLTTNPIPNAQVRLEIGGSPVYTVTSNGSGVFTFSSINAGTYEMVCTAGGYIDWNGSVTVLNGQDISGQNITMLIRPRIRGGVRNFNTDTPINGATVRLEQNSVVKYTTTTNTNGDYILNNLDPGSYQLIASAVGFESKTFTVNLAAGNEYFQNFALNPNPRILGVVRHSITLAAISGATVRLEQNSIVKYSTTTNASGNYILTDVAAGTYQLVAFAPGYQTKRMTITVVATLDYNQNITLLPAPQLISPAMRQNWTNGAIDFIWGNIAASRYELYVDNIQDYSSAEVCPRFIPALANYTDTTYTLQENWLEPNQTYYWKVVAYYPNGDTVPSYDGTFTYNPTSVATPDWTPLYRVYNATDVDHSYCITKSKLDEAYNLNYTFERIEGFVSAKPFNSANMVSIYRFYIKNPVPRFKRHLYVTEITDPNIRDTLIANDTNRYYEGIVGYAYSNQPAGTVKLYHTYMDRVDKKDNLYTISEYEMNFSRAVNGYTGTTNDQGFICYVSQSGNIYSQLWNETQMQAGNGVNPITGNFTHKKNTFSIPGGRMALEFSHIYNSYAPRFGLQITSLGNGFSHNYSACLHLEGTSSSSTIYAYWPQGSIQLYNLGSLNSVRCATPGVYDVITKISPTRYQIRKPDQSVYSFDVYQGSLAMLTSITDRNSNPVTLTYNSATNQLISARTAEGRILAFEYYTPEGQKHLLKKVTDPAGRFVSFEYDANYNLIRFTDAEGYIYSYNYDQNYLYDHLLTELVMPKGNKIINVYQNSFADKKLISQTYGSGKPFTFDYNGNGFVVYKDEVDKFWTQYYDATPEKKVTKLQSPIGDTVSFEYGDVANPTNITRTIDGKGLSSTFTYDAQGNCTRINKPLGVIQRFSYNAWNDVLTYTNPNGRITSYQYDAFGNLIRVMTPRGTTTINYIFGGNGQSGVIRDINDPLGRRVVFTYNANGNIATVTDNIGNRTSYTYDNVSRLTNIINPKGSNIFYTYNKNDWLTVIKDQNNDSTKFVYDSNGNQTGVINAQNKLESYAYNLDKDQLFSRNNPISETTRFYYNTNGNVSTILTPDNFFLYYEYYNDGKLKNFNTSNYNATLQYDANHNLTQISDSKGSITFSTYDDLNRIKSYTDYYGNTVSYLYDNNSNVTSLIYPGSKTVTYSYYDDNLLRSVTDWNNRTTTYYYNTDGSLEHIENANGTRCFYTYDNAGRLQRMFNRKSNNDTINHYRFTIDSLGNYTYAYLFEQLTTMPVNSSYIIYSYDDANRILSAGTENFTFDKRGNMTQRAGNVSYGYSYDNLNRLTAVMGNISSNYVYDYFGNRREVTASGKTSRYVIDVNSMTNNILMETDNTGAPVNYYVYGLGLVSRVKATGATYYYHYDARGSTTAMTDISQIVTHKYTYTDFGDVSLKLEPKGDGNPFRYLGRLGVMDEGNGLLFMHSRYYYPKIGRFITENPVWEVNLFPYADNNPIIGAEPLGYIGSLDYKIGKSHYLMDNRKRGYMAYTAKLYSSATPYIGNLYKNRFIDVNSLLIGNSSALGTTNSTLIGKLGGAVSTFENSFYQPASIAMTENYFNYSLNPTVTYLKQSLKLLNIDRKVSGTLNFNGEISVPFYNNNAK
ncbi:MAG: hypothetical protein HW421_2612 [Ignavibacteria bacterium]|nr:hypothetical protein [Ignavibacteria bacterium]